MDNGIPEEAEGVGLPAVRAGIGRAEQPVRDGDGDAGDQAAELRAPEALGLGGDTGQAVQGERAGSGLEPVAAGGRGVHQPAEEHRGVVPVGAGGDTG